MDTETREALSRIYNWADRLADDENQDRTMILEGTLAQIGDLADGTLQELEHYTRMFTRG